MRAEMVSRTLWPDGDFPGNKIDEVFQFPPGITAAPSRSCLVVGGLGSGKTTLFRHIKRDTEISGGVAIYLPLTSVLESLNKAGAAVAIPEQELGLIAKTSSLIAAAVAVELARLDIEIPTTSFSACLPSSSLAGLGNRESDYREFQSELADLPLSEFKDRRANARLRTFLEDVAKPLQSAGRKFVLLFDRADNVPPSCLVPLVGLLDQPQGYVALVGTRPGVRTSAFLRFALTGTPGDHYSIQMLGDRPWDPNWRAFVQRAVEAQIGHLDLPPLRIEAVIALCRDSVRHALLAFDEIMRAPQGKRDAAALEFLARRRQQLNITARSAATNVHLNINQFFKRCLKDTNLHPEECRPVHVEILANDHPTQFVAPDEYATRTRDLLDIGLRSGFFGLASGEVWSPTLDIRVVEINPLLVWNPQHGLPSRVEEIPAEVKIDETDVFNVPIRPATRRIFAAYRFADPSSKWLRKEFETHVKARPGLKDCEVTDGRGIALGQRWAVEIRDRISKAHALMGDVTGVRKEIAFELGFAFGLRRRIIPVVIDGSAPKWLQGIQYVRAENRADVSALVEEIHVMASRGELHKPASVPQPNMGRVVLVGLKGPLDPLRAFVEHETAQNSMPLTIMEDQDLVQPEAQDAASVAGLIIARLDESWRDDVVHFLTGAVMANPTQTIGKHSFDRQVILIAPDRFGQGVLVDRAPEFVAAAAIQCRPHVLVVSGENYQDAIKKYGVRWLEYLRSQPVGPPVRSLND